MSEKIANRNAFTVNETIVSILKNDWLKILQKYCFDQNTIEEIFQFLVEKYSEKHRAYHNLSHINYLLEEAKKIEFANFEAIYLAAWFHDVIYDPHRNDNESESAKFAVELLSEMDFPNDKITKIEKIIIATQTHSAENLDDDGKIFLDLDLSILGAGEKIYYHYSQAIRQEYSHVPVDLYHRGRRKVLENFLRRETIYFSEILQQRFERQARLNLANEIKELS